MSGWVAGAIFVGAGISAYASMEAADAQTEAIEKSAETTAQTTADTNAMLQAQYEQTRADQEPWRLAGEDALQRIQETPEFQFDTPEFDFFADPSYQFRMDEGVRALDRSAASRGRTLSGAQDRAVTRYGQNLASQEYGNAFNRYLQQNQQDFNVKKAVYDTNLNTQKSLAGVGQQSVNTLAQVGAQNVGAQANVAMQGAQAQNALTMQGAQVQGQMATNIANTANQAMGNYLLYDTMKKD